MMGQFETSIWKHPPHAVAQTRLSQTGLGGNNSYSLYAPIEGEYDQSNRARVFKGGGMSCKEAGDQRLGKGPTTWGGRYFEFVESNRNKTVRANLWSSLTALWRRPRGGRIQW